MSTLSLARRRLDIQALTHPAQGDDDWRRNLSESGLRASLNGDTPAPRKAVWDTSPATLTRTVDEDYDRSDDESAHSVPVGPPHSGPDEPDEPESDQADNESSRSRSPDSASRSHSRARSSSESTAGSPRHSALPALPGRLAWPHIPNPHPSLLTAAQGQSLSGPVRPRREAARRQPHAPVPTIAHRARVAAPVPVEGLTKKSRGRRVPTANSAVEGDVVFQAGKDGEKPTRMFACTVDGCGKCFHRGEHLKRHIRSIHTNERPHSCPEPDCLKTFSRHDNLIQHMKTHGKTLPPTLSGASASHESLDQPSAALNGDAYRYYPGPVANMNQDHDSEMRGQSEVDPESEDDSPRGGANADGAQSDGETKSNKMELGDESKKDDSMDVDEVKQPEPAPEQIQQVPQAPTLGRPRTVQAPLVVQSGSTVAAVASGSFVPPARSRNPSDTSGKTTSSSGELQCPHVPCGKTFRRGEHLRRHIKGIHLAERPWECPHPECGKRFSRHDNLMQHAKRHTRPVPVPVRKPGAAPTPRPKRVESVQPVPPVPEDPEFESEDEC